MQVKILIDKPWLNEMLGVLLLLLALGVLLSLLSYSPTDPSFNLVTVDTQARNWMGLPGSYAADLIYQSVGLVGFLIPVWIIIAAVHRIRDEDPRHPARHVAGGIVLTVVSCAALALVAGPLEGALPGSWLGVVQPGGTFGDKLARNSTAVLNIGGTALVLVATSLVGIYLLTSLQLSDFLRRRPPVQRVSQEEARADTMTGWPAVAETPPDPPDPEPTTQVGTISTRAPVPEEPVRTQTGWNEPPQPAPPVVPYSTGTGEQDPEKILIETVQKLQSPKARVPRSARSRPRARYPLPQTSLLNPRTSRAAYSESQLQETARQIIAKYEEFGVRGTISQIHPGPVVTTFELKPARGVKYSKVANFSDDLCLALECESILIERLPGKPTVGIEVPNKDREIISLREVVESKPFRKSKSLLSFALGKDINGGIHHADLATMPHLLVAGQTGSGKSVMINSVIMSLLLRTSPDEVRLILVDPKTVELGLYRDIPHLLTPVITDMKSATNALRNATREMERRLNLLAQHGVRNLAQFNAKMARKKDAEDAEAPLPYIVIIVDELADLMVLARGRVEESIQRLAQMARAVGIHLILATQRPSVDVITGLIKANIPARLSFLVATRVDSRTILDSMGAESLLGKGDMLFLPPGVGRMRRLHGPLVTEDEIEVIVSHWKNLARPQYEHAYLESSDEEDERDLDGDAGSDDPKYRDAVRLVVSMGKASTSILQRRLRVGYGRAARLLDSMEQEGIIGPPDGSRPRNVLKTPGWLAEAGEG